MIDKRMAYHEIKNIYSRVDALFNGNDKSKEDVKRIVRLLLLKKDAVEELLNITGIRETVMGNIGHVHEINNLNMRIGDKNFTEPNDIFDELGLFFTANYGVKTDIYRYTEKNDSKTGIQEKMLKPIKRRGSQKYANIACFKDTDTSLEEKALLNEGFSYEKKGDIIKSSVRFEYSIFEGENEKVVFMFTGEEKSIRKIESLFNESSISQLVRAKLNMIKENIDELTGLYNKRYINLIKGGRYSLISIDINDFKKLNDTCGHAKGDDVLIEFGGILKDCVRAENDDKPCRNGGDEFLVFVDSTDKAVLDRIRKSIIDAVDLKNQNQPNEDMKYTLSIGYEIYDESVSYDKRAFLADFNMYNTKTKNGKIHRVVSQFRDLLINFSLSDLILVSVLLGNEVLLISPIKIKQKIRGFLDLVNDKIKLLSRLNKVDVLSDKKDEA
ncbi:MAG: GGDEF domain-containing protein [Candidatus Gracilibacteria bacterium]|nr:GGDEF domain-containing protein [Candidatus Gracilibacteria bacterium]